MGGFADSVGHSLGALIDNIAAAVGGAVGAFVHAVTSVLPGPVAVGLVVAAVVLVLFLSFKR